MCVIRKIWNKLQLLDSLMNLFVLFIFQYINTFFRGLICKNLENACVWQFLKLDAAEVYILIGSMISQLKHNQFHLFWQIYKICFRCPFISKTSCCTLGWSSSTLYSGFSKKSEMKVHVLVLEFFLWLK